MITDTFTRRLFLQGTGSLAGSALMRAGLPAFVAVSQAACSAGDEGSGFANLSADEAREIVAIAARIIPTTDTPGATEAGVVYFFDEAFGNFLAGSVGAIRNGFGEFQVGVQAAHPGTTRFSDLEPAAQDAYLSSVEHTPFFQDFRFLTIAGVFGMSMYGGNRDNVGWRLVGMDGPPHGWAAPFGYYDARYEEAHGGDQ